MTARTAPAGIADALETPFMAACVVCANLGEETGETAPLLRSQDLHFRGRDAYVCELHRAFPMLAR